MKGKIVALTLVLLATATASALPDTVLEPVAEHHETPIQPGAQMTAPYGCTMNFVFRDDAGKLYIGTAGHCVDREGQSVSLQGVGPIGTVEWLGGTLDFALVEISPSLYALVNPSVRHWGGPTGVSTAPAFGIAGQPIYHYGYGIGYGVSKFTRPRVGIATLQNSARYLAETTAVFGDSGSPIVLADGRALGVVSQFAFLQGHTDVGPTVEYVLNRAVAEKNLRLTLVTAPLADPVQREIDRASHPGL